MGLPRWMEPLLEAGEMREVDRWAIHEREVAVDELMERAGEGLAGVVARRAPAGRIVIVCGKGNNGGDGIVAARLLRQAGRDVEVLRGVAARVDGRGRAGAAEEAARAGAGGRSRRGGSIRRT